MNAVVTGGGSYTPEHRETTEKLAMAVVYNAIKHGNRPAAVVTLHKAVCLERCPADALALAEAMELAAAELRRWAAKNMAEEVER